MNKVLYTPNYNQYEPEICSITYPLIKQYCHKIGADFRIIDKPFDLGVDTKISGKFHLHKLAQEKNQITMFLDSDALIHPDAPDFMIHCIGPKLVFCFGQDYPFMRFRADQFFAYAQANGLVEPYTMVPYGMCTWCVICNDSSYHVWEPPVNAAEAISYITPTVVEAHIKTAASLLDDYQTSLNLVKHKLTIINGIEALTAVKYTGVMPFYHQYLVTPEEKARQLKFVRDNVWGLGKDARFHFDLHASNFNKEIFSKFNPKKWWQIWK